MFLTESVHRCTVFSHMTQNGFSVCKAKEEGNLVASLTGNNAANGNFKQIIWKNVSVSVHQYSVFIKRTILKRAQTDLFSDTRYPRTVPASTEHPLKNASVLIRFLPSS